MSDPTTPGPSIAPKAASLRIETVVLNDEHGRIRFNPDPRIDIERPRRLWSPAKLGLILIAIALAGLIGLDLAAFLAVQFGYGAIYGWSAIGLIAIGVAGVTYWALAEYAALAGLRSIEQIRVVLASSENTRRARVQWAIDRFLRGLDGRPDVAAAIAAYRVESVALQTPSEQIALLSRAVLPPLDAQANTAIARAVTLGFGANFLSPTALLDTISFVFRSARLARTIAEIYGHRPGVLATIGLIRMVIANAGMVGTADAAGHFAANMAGTLFARLSTDLASSVFAAQRIARLGRLTQQVCRPLPLDP